MQLAEGARLEVNALVYSSSLVAAFRGGILALFAPCRIVPLLPTFVGIAMQRAREQLPVTAALFAAGVATVLLPIVLSIGALGRLFGAQHRLVFPVVRVLVAFLGVNILAGWRWSLPMPALHLRTGGSGSGSVSSSDWYQAWPAPSWVTSGSVCRTCLAWCSPVFLAALFWDRWPVRIARFRQASPVHIGGRRISWSDLLAGTIFLAIAILASALLVTGAMSYSPDWLSAWNRWAAATAANLAAALRDLPAYVQGLVLVALAAGTGVALYRPRWHHKHADAHDQVALSPAGGASESQG